MPRVLCDGRRLVVGARRVVAGRDPVTVLVLGLLYRYAALVTSSVSAPAGTACSCRWDSR